MLMSELFENCAYKIQYIQQEDVDYKFIEDYENRILYIYFQCTKNNDDWVSNANFMKKTYESADISFRCHGGFLDCWMKIKQIVVNKVSDPLFQHIVIAGYSHGGALAMLCQETCWYCRPDLRGHITGYAFGGPRVFGEYKIPKEIQERWNDFYIIKNCTDLVPHLPFWIMGFCHCGSFINIGGNQKKLCFQSHYPENILESIKKYEIKNNITDIIK